MAVWRESGRPTPAGTSPGLPQWAVVNATFNSYDRATRGRGSLKLMRKKVGQIAIVAVAATICCSTTETPDAQGGIAMRAATPPPQHLSVVSVTMTSVSIDWNRPTASRRGGAVAYGVYVNGTRVMQ